MSTHWGYVCLSHDPELPSERWLNHGDRALADAFRKERAGEWPNCTEEDVWGGEGEPYDLLPEGDQAIPVRPHGGGGAPPWSGVIEWLRQHPGCHVALRNEYGVTEEITDESKLPTAPEGWKLIAPSEAKPGDGVYRVGFGVALLGPMMFDPIPIEIRWESWAVRRVE